MTHRAAAMTEDDAHGTWRVRPGVLPDGDVLICDEYLAADECTFIANELEYVLWRASEVVRVDPNGGLVTFRSDERTSTSTSQKWFSEELNARLAALEARLAADFGPPPAYLEQWQGVRYPPGGRFGLHTDAGAFATEPWGERVLTFLVYLQTPEAGGETYFPRLNRLVEPIRGRIVVWHNLLPDGTVDQRMLHAATPPRTGTKAILTTWSRQRPVRH